MEEFYTHQTEILNHQVQLRDEQRGGIRSIEKGIKNLWRKKKNHHLYHLHHLHNHLLRFSSTSMASTYTSSSNPSKKIKLTIIPPRQLFVDLSSEEDDTTTYSFITKSSSPSPPNVPSKTPSSKDTSSSFGTTSSLFESKPQSSPPSSNDTTSCQPSNPFLNDIMDVPLRPSNLIPLQSHPSLDITLSLSPITPLDRILDTTSLPSPQPLPQPPLMGHPIYFNTFDYHGVNYFFCFHNQNLIFSLRDEMNLMFAHIEYLFTSAIASPSPPHP
ncbi:hypothetical protein Tco_0873107 [Tanacetum coccineum]